MEAPARRGFTLVEALVAMAIFALGLAALMPLVIANVRANQGAAVRTQAVALAQRELEGIRAMEYEQVRTLAASPPPAQIVDGIYTLALQFPPTPTLAGDAGDLTRVQVTVGWDLGSRGAGTVSFLTTKARY